MRILLVNNHHKVCGGAERYYFDLGQLLKSKGHVVAYFSMKDYGNIKSKWSKYFVSNVDPNKNGYKEFFNKIPRIFYSLESKRQIAKLLDDFKPDIVHLNNICYHITSSILGEIKKRDIPIVQTVHDYQLISPNESMYHDGNICEISKTRKYYKSIFHKCNNNSYIGSLIMSTILYFQNFNNSYFKKINAFIAPSKYLADKFVEYGVDGKTIIHINNFVKLQKNINYIKQKKRYILFSGKLTEAKGIYQILDTAEQLSEINFKIVGNFINNTERKNILNKIKLANFKNVNFLCFKNKKSLNKLIQQSEFVIVPSRWNENQPYSILEAYALGKPVIASKIGGVSEIVVDGKTGLLFNYKIDHDLVNKIKLLWNNKVLLRQMSSKCRDYASKKFNPDQYYNKINAIYINLSS